MKLTQTLSTKSGKIWFFSDLHIGHQNVIRHDNRPFETVEEMDEFIEKTIRETIKPGDTVFDLGDMFWKKKLPECDAFLKNCFSGVSLYKLMGNHDKEGLYYGSPNLAGHFKMIADLLEIGIDDGGTLYRATLSHFPITSWNHKSRGAIDIHGHCHGNIDHVNESSPDLKLDIGYNSNISKKFGSFIIPWEAIRDNILEKTGGLSPKKYMDKLLETNKNILL